MTADLVHRVPGRQLGHPALARCVAEDLGDFAARRWGREPVLSQAADLPASFDDLLDVDAVDELVSRRGLRAPFLRVAKDGTTLGDRAFTSSGGLGATIADQLDDDKLLRLLSGGSTMVLQGLHRTWPPLIGFSQQLAADLGHPVQVNAYVTPPQSRGFSDHYDVHDVFVMQVHGEKRWVIRPPVHPLPLRDQPWTDRRSQVEAAAAGPPLLDVVLRPGDCLYLPRGYLHSATALGSTTIHLTVGVHAWTRLAAAESLVQTALARLAEQVEARESLALGVDVGDAEQLAGDVELVRAALLTAVAQVPPHAVADRLREQADRGSRPSPVGPLGQLALAAELAPATRVVLRPHLRARLRDDADGGVVLTTRVGEVAVDLPARRAAEALLAGQPWSVQELAAVADADVEVATDLVRRLVRAGIAVRATA